MKTKLLLLSFCASIMMYSNSTKAQTVLAPGDIAVFWYQADTPDSFAFTTFVDIMPGTQILFTDCGAVPAGTFDPAGCGEGAFVYTAPTGGLTIGDIVQYNDLAPGPDFADYGGDSTIIGGTGMSLSTGGDQITVIQGTGVAPTFISMLSGSSTTFSGDDSLSTTQTNLFTGLVDTGLPRTAVAVGSGPAPSQENDNAMYTGVYTFATVDEAKIALTNPANYYGTQAITDGTYAALVGGIPAVFTYTTLSTGDVTLENSVFVAPNPSNGTITIKNAGNVLQSAVITDLNGRLVSQLNLNGNTGDQEINLSNVLSSGMYFMTISTENQSTIKKIIIK
ncbi:Por secretion system C-terminal sorting domain-containing protein [Formosa sp. Hel1_31_208]|uniref:T9SS type A sorting domain-containing protein n=1 Tax=Formosa sp. Hel1_31_208 TaxID=1798225 RepID=UPI00087A5A3F|nr:T9SS type A sorting domain-containing protein [Formosa sp. Hel1_31_208]SDR83605.1 Por secretion system C-terminal sorting domain-containing protein [Formosa sp. Hel1_31_208]